MGKKEDKEKREVGRPPTEINWGEVAQFCLQGANGVQIAGYLGIHPDTLYRACQNEKGMNFADFAAQNKAKGDTLLLNRIFDGAMKGNDKYMLLLAKTRLGMSEKQQVEITSTSGAINIIVNSSANPPILEE